MNRWMKLALISLAAAPLLGCNAAQQAANRTGNAVTNAAGYASQLAGNTANAVTPRVPPPGGAAANRITVEQRIADQVVRQAHVRGAYVMVVGNTAYVAVQLHSGVQPGLAQRTKDRITHVVKAAHPQIRTVYVSANPDLYQQFGRFTTDLQAGRPVDAVWSSFRAAIQRAWPTAR
jgi:YhcN/YlaJ family sporulation lipoprotein